MNAVAPTTSTSAIVSLIFGILSWVFIPVVGALVAIIAGHIARSEIRNAHGRIEGDGLAVAGLILGYLQLAFIAAALAFVFLVLGGVAALAIFGSGA
jgi:hypothetical protein